AEDGIRDFHVTGVQTCALPIYANPADNSSGDVNVNGGAGVNIQSPRATQFYIRRVGQTAYQVGYSTDNLETLIQYGANIDVQSRSEERRVGKEREFRWWTDGDC